MTEAVTCPRCRITFAPGSSPPPVCPNCLGPWGGPPPGQHGTVRYDQHELGYIAWCSCGVGTPPKASVDEAQRSLAAHVANPAELPR